MCRTSRPAGSVLAVLLTPGGGAGLVRACGRGELLVQMPAWQCHIPCPASPARGSVAPLLHGFGFARLAGRLARLARPGPVKLYRRTMLVMDGRADEQCKDGSQRAVDRC